MRASSVLGLVVMLLVQSGCSLFLPAIGANRAAPVRGPQLVLDSLQSGTRVMMVTKAGRTQVGLWRDMEVRGEGRRLSIRRENGVVERFVEADIRGVYHPIYPPVDRKRASNLFVTGLIVDVGLILMISLSDSLDGLGKVFQGF